MVQIDLLIVNPSARKKIYQDSQEAMQYPAIEPPYIAALTAEFVRKRGYNVRIIDINAENLSNEETADIIKNYNSKLVHIIVHGNQPSASSQLMTTVSNLCKNIKERDKSIKILLSGTHPSALSRRTLEEEACDFVARGEGFFTVLGILSEKSLSEISGLSYKENDHIFLGKPDRILEPKELDSNFEKAAWDLLPIAKYRAHDWHCLNDLNSRQSYAAIYTSFGCPFKCNFCCINSPFNEGNNGKHTIRHRNPEIIVNEIEYLVNNFGIKNLKIIDEMFVYNKDHYIQIANGIIQKGFGDKLNIWAYARIDTIKENYLDLLKRAGFNWLALGIESGNENVRKSAIKGKFDKESIIKTVRKIQDSGIYVAGNYIFGLPYDNKDSMQDTLDLAKELNCERPNFYCAMAYPGSELHKLAEKRKIPLPKNWDTKRALLPEEKGGPGWIGYSQHAYETWPLPTETLFPEEILEFRDKASLGYFKDISYQNMLSKRFGKINAKIFCRINSKISERLILTNKV